MWIKSFAACLCFMYVSFAAAAGNFSGSESPEHGAVISFESMAHDFGTIERKGDSRTVGFVFHNDGDAPLVITRAETSCTCLAVDYPRQPVMPGECGTVEITYRPGRETGPFNNNVKIHSNTASKYPSMLFVRGEVVEKQ